MGANHGAISILLVATWVQSIGLIRHCRQSPTDLADNTQRQFRVVTSAGSPAGHQRIPGVFDTHSNPTYDGQGDPGELPNVSGFFDPFLDSYLVYMPHTPMLFFFELDQNLDLL
jgi:hypothetical protein